MNTVNVASNLSSLTSFMSNAQIAVIGQGLRGEEKEFFADKLAEQAAVVAAMPKTYETDGQGDEAVAHLHYFMGGMDWFITEKDCEAMQHQAFGLVDMGHGPELGYISIVELMQHNIEMDLHWEPKTLAEIKAAKS